MVGGGLLKVEEHQHLGGDGLGWWRKRGQNEPLRERKEGKRRLLIMFTIVWKSQLAAGEKGAKKNLTRTISLDGGRKGGILRPFCRIEATAYSTAEEKRPRYQRKPNQST